MVKLQTICRTEKEHQRETKNDIFKVFRSTNPQLHPFQKAREYQRALTSVKLEKIFAQPFLGCLVGSSDFINVFAKAPDNLTKFLSGSYDGEIRLWDISIRKSIFSINAHEKCIKGLTFSNSGSVILSSGDDKTINLYELEKCMEQANEGQHITPRNKYISKQLLSNIDHKRNQSQFATAGQAVQIWDYDRSQPVQVFEWGPDSITQLKFNPSETDLLAATGIDRSVVLYDLRGGSPLRKVFLANKANCIQWNPREPINFTVGSDDANCYTFDMRRLDNIRMIHKDHIRTVMDIDYAPSGKEFVTGSYDKTVRIFPTNSGKSREVYHGKRMQKYHPYILYF